LAGNQLVENTRENASIVTTTLFVIRDIAQIVIMRKIKREFKNRIRKPNCIIKSYLNIMAKLASVCFVVKKPKV